MHLHVRVYVTIAALTAFGLVALVMGQNELAALAVGALAGYLGKVNGTPTNPAS